MEEKNKALLQQLAIIFIPILFVAIPCILIDYLTSIPHAARVDRDALLLGYNYSISMMSTMTGGETSLNCAAESARRGQYFDYFILDPYVPRHAYFRPHAPPYVVRCKWAYMGSFARGVVLFNSSAPYAEQCRWENGGCRYYFSDGQLFLVTGRRRPRQQDQERVLVGDLPLRECEHILGIFTTSCHLKPHSHEYVGQAVSRMQWWFS